ncbi:hypothetical protein [Enterovirga sp. CN4-39]|uniref:hypothetical protein n=1 Tax=Enterovirga sp. CN4-39 TaxID=3400910 RepID=UPI003C0BF5FD
MARIALSFATATSFSFAGKRSALAKAASNTAAEARAVPSAAGFTPSSELMFAWARSVACASRAAWARRFHFSIWRSDAAPAFSAASATPPKAALPACSTSLKAR